MTQMKCKVIIEVGNMTVAYDYMDMTQRESSLDDIAMVYALCEYIQRRDA